MFPVEVFYGNTSLLSLPQLTLPHANLRSLGAPSEYI